MDPKPYWPNQYTYFLTGTTFLHYPYFQSCEQKQVVLNQILKISTLLQLPQSELIYSIAINHYHLKCYIENGLMLGKIKQIIHGGTSFEYKSKYPMKYKQMWSSSRIIRITSDEMDFKITGYIIGNLLKHKEVNTFEELRETPFSSYRTILNKHDEEYLKQCVYSVIDVQENSSGILDLEEIQKVKLPSAKAG